MNAPFAIAADHRESRVIRDFIILAKPRISVMVLLTVAVAGLISVDQWALPLSMVHAMIGLFLVSASGCAVNQYLERYVDWMMPRTSRRPLPDQRLTARSVAVFGAVTLGAGLAWLVTLVNWQAMAIALANWLIYVWIYTPMKPRTWLNTFVGAVAGAMPILVGAAAAGEGGIGGPAWLLFAVLYLWQFPHFMAIAWLYQDDYRRGNLRMASTEPDGARLSGRIATGFAAALLPVTIVAVWPGNPVEAALWALGSGLGLWYLVASVRFQASPDNETARYLFRVSLVYLPAWLGVLTLSELTSRL